MSSPSTPGRTVPLVKYKWFTRGSSEPSFRVGRIRNGSNVNPFASRRTLRVDLITPNRKIDLERRTECPRVGATEL